MTPLYPAGVYAPLPRFSKKTHTNIAPSAIRMTASARCSRPELIVSAASMGHLRVCRQPSSLQLERMFRPDIRFLRRQHRVQGVRRVRLDVERANAPVSDRLAAGIDAAAIASPGGGNSNPLANTAKK